MRARPTYYCPACGEAIKEVHKPQGLNTSDVIGDTFLYYASHTCKLTKDLIVTGDFTKPKPNYAK